MASKNNSAQGAPANRFALIASDDEQDTEDSDDCQEEVEEEEKVEEEEEVAEDEEVAEEEAEAENEEKAAEEVVAEKEEEVAEKEVAQQPALVRSASQKSLSTSEGSASSSSQPVSSEAATGKSPFSSQDAPFSPVVADSPAAQAVIPQAPADVIGHVCMPNGPIWVDNGVKGDKARWILVQPKFEYSGNAADGVAKMLKASKNTQLLGPSVTTKNTFLEESRIDGVRLKYQRTRANSWDASRLRRK